MLFGMKISDANCLAKAIKATETLASLVLQVRGRGRGETLIFSTSPLFKFCFVLLSSPRHLAGASESPPNSALCRLPRAGPTLFGDLLLFWSLLRQGNLIDDDLMRMLMTGLIRNSTITYLDVSHNKITNHGEPHNSTQHNTVVPPYISNPFIPTTIVGAV